MLKVEHLSIHFEDRSEKEEVVRDVSFQMENGEILGIVGESGSGKTMTALTVAGLLKKHAILDAGKIWLDETDLLQLSEKEMRKVQGNDIGMIFQEPMTALNPTMRIGKQVEEALVLHRSHSFFDGGRHIFGKRNRDAQGSWQGTEKNMTKEERRSLALKALEEVELEHPEQLYEKYPHELSGGMRQRVMIAAAAVCRPKLLIADEPTTALDVGTQESILKLLKKLNRKYGMSILFISHNLRVVNTLCSHVLVMKDGRVVEEGECGKIFENPQSEYTKELIAAIPARTKANRYYDLPGRTGEDFGSESCEVTVHGALHPAARHPANKAVVSGIQPPTVSQVVNCDHVNAYYKEGKTRRQVLEDVSFTLYEGEIVGLVGESGSGKSTLCKCVLGLLKDYDGEIRHYTERPQMVFQDPFSALNPRKTVGWILEEPLRVKGGFSRQERRKEAVEMLQRVHLPEDFYERYPRELSGGQRQRVSIALALITGTKFILADEPLSALDVTVQAQIIALLKELQEKEKICYLFVSHDLDVVSMLCSRVLYLRDGKVRCLEGNC